MKRGAGNAALALPDFKVKPGVTVAPVHSHLSVVPWQGMGELAEKASPPTNDRTTESDDSSRTQPDGRPEGVSDQALKDAWLAVHCAAATPKTTRVKRVVEPGIECRVRKPDHVSKPRAVLAPWAVTSPPNVNATTLSDMIQQFELTSHVRHETGRTNNVADLLDPRAVDYVLKQHRDRVNVHNSMVTVMCNAAKLHHDGLVDEDGRVVHHAYDFHASIERRKLEREDKPDQIDVTGMSWNTEARLVPANDPSYHAGEPINEYFVESEDARRMMWKHWCRSYFQRKRELTAAFAATESTIVSRTDEVVVDHPQVPKSLFVDPLAVERDMLDYKLGNYLRYYSRGEFLKDFESNINWCIDTAPSNIRAAVFNERAAQRRYKLRAIASRNRKAQPMSAVTNVKDFLKLFREDVKLIEPKSTVNEMTAAACRRIYDSIIAQCEAAKAQLREMADAAIVSFGDVMYSPDPESGLYLPDVEATIRKELAIESKFNLDNVVIKALPVL